MAVFALNSTAAEQSLDFSPQKFAEPRDKGFLPGVGENIEQQGIGVEESYDPSRDVYRWQRTGRRGRVTSREIWTNEYGLPQGRLSVGRPF